MEVIKFRIGSNSRSGVSSKTVTISAQDSQFHDSHLCGSMFSNGGESVAIVPTIKIVM